MSGPRIAALDIGGTNLKAALFEQGRPLHRLEIPTRAQEGAGRVLARAAEQLEAFRPFDAVGVSTAGQVEPGTGVIRYANENLPGYTGMRVKDFFEGRFGVPTAVENDVNAAALGEGAKGAARGERDYLCVTYGTGVGGAVVVDGRLYRGACGSAGEFGAVLMHPEQAVPGDPFSGCYERCASTTALVAAAAAADPALTDGRAIFSRLEETQVRAVVDRWLDEVAGGLCTLIHIFNPACVLLGGGVMEQPYVISGVRARVEARIIPSFQNVRLAGAELGNTAGLCGAAWAAEQLLPR